MLTGLIGLSTKAGRYGGTFGHKDVAFQFGMWISPKFQLLLVREYKRLIELFEQKIKKKIGEVWGLKGEGAYDKQLEEINN